MFCFIDEKGLKVEMAFQRGILPIEPKHVLVFVQYEGQWLCTIHKQRGVEIPGGKLEQGETLEQAVLREVYEETGVVVENPRWFAEYVVYDKMPFCKAVFVANFVSQDNIAFNFETSGLLWISKEQLFERCDLSFYMRDVGMVRLFQEVECIAKR